MMKVLQFAAIVWTVVLAGCGGNNDPAPQPNNGTPRIEAVTQLDTSQIQDPNNFQINESFIFQLVRYNSGGTREILTGVTWAANSSSSTYATLAENSGLFTAKGSETPQTQAVQANWEGQQFVVQYQIKPRQVRLTGRVVDESKPIQGVDSVVVKFFALTAVDISDPTAPRSEVEVGSVTTSYDGTFRASVPSTALYFQIDDASVPPTYFRSYVYPTPVNAAARFDTGTATCRPPLPTDLPDVGLKAMPASIRLTPKPSGTPVAPLPSACYR